MARGRHLEAVRRSGLLVRSPLGDVRTSPGSVVESVADVDGADLVVVAVKLWDTEDVARQLGASKLAKHARAVAAERRAEGHRPRPPPSRRVPARRRLLHLRLHRGTGRRPPQRHPPAHGVRRPAPQSGAGGASVPPGVHRGGHRRRDQRGRRPGDLGEVRLPRRPLGRHHRRPPAHRRRPLPRADAGPAAGRHGGDRGRRPRVGRRAGRGLRRASARLLRHPPRRHDVVHAQRPGTRPPSRTALAQRGSGRPRRRTRRPRARNRTVADILSPYVDGAPADA